MIDQVAHAGDLAHLVAGQKGGRRPGEAAHAEQAVEGAGQLVAVHQAELTHAQGQVAVGVGLMRRPACRRGSSWA